MSNDQVNDCFLKQSQEILEFLKHKPINNIATQFWLARKLEKDFEAIYEVAKTGDDRF